MLSPAWGWSALAVDDVVVGEVGVGAADEDEEVVPEEPERGVAAAGAAFVDGEAVWVVGGPLLTEPILATGALGVVALTLVRRRGALAW